MYGPIQWDQAPAGEAEAVGQIVGRVHDWEKGLGNDLRTKNDQRYEQYRGFKQFQNNWVQAGPRDRDGLIYDAKQTWGAELHIPLSFRTVETIVPRAIANMPKLLVEPRDEQWVENVRAVKMLINAQQEQINIDLPFQEVMRSGHIYGLGVGKSYWKHEVKFRRRMQRNTLDLGYNLSNREPYVHFDDPFFEAIDIRDFMWDSRGYDIASCEWVIHRVWLSVDRCMKQLETKAWNTESAQLLDEDKVKGLGSNTHYDEVWQRRMTTAGLPSFSATNMGQDRPHELLEFHNGDMVLSVLDRQVLVQEGENPCGEIPFQVFRPTPMPHEMVGIGSLEPIWHLQRELDSLRSQRRNAATLTLNAPWVYDSASVDPEDLVFGPEQAIPVANADVNTALRRVEAKDLPGSGYEEEQAILSNIEAVSGMTDALDNHPGPSSSTATEAQLSQASLGRRIELTSRRFEIEVVREVARCFLHMDQRMITAQRQMRQPQEGMDRSEASEAGEWKWFPVGPEQLEGEWTIEVDGGSMAAKNTPQERADANQILQALAHDWYINPTKARLFAMEKMGIKHPQAWLRDPTPNVPLVALRFLLNDGVDPNRLIQAVLRAREVSAPQEGPAAQQVAEQIPSPEGMH